VLVLRAPDSTWHVDPALVARYPHGSETFAIPSSPKAAPITIDYAIVAPGQLNR